MSSRAQSQQSQKGHSGCGTLIGVAIVLGLAIEFWYVSLGLIALAMLAWGIHAHRARVRKRHRTGPKDPWINEVAVALLDLGLHEHARNTGNRLGGAVLEADVCLRGRGGEFWIHRFAAARQAHEAEMGLRARADFRQTLTSGRRALQTHGRLLGVTRVRRGVADEILLDEVMRVAGRIALEAGLAPRPLALPISPTLPSDALSALDGLAALRDAGVVTEEEFARKKPELLDRL
jgi:hypothetical protein